MSALVIETAPVALRVFKITGCKSHADEDAAYNAALDLYHQDKDFHRYVLTSIESARKERQRKTDDDDFCKTILLVCFVEYQRSQQLIELKLIQLTDLRAEVDMMAKHAHGTIDPQLRDMYDRLMKLIDELRQGDPDALLDDIEAVQLSLLEARELFAHALLSLADGPH